MMSSCPEAVLGSFTTFTMCCRALGSNFGGPVPPGKVHQLPAFLHPWKLTLTDSLKSQSNRKGFVTVSSLIHVKNSAPQFKFSLSES